MAIVLPSIIQAAPAVPLGPDILPHTHNPGHGIRVMDFLLSPSMSPSDKHKLLKQAIIREQAEAAAAGREEKHSAPRHTDDIRRLKKRQMVWRKIPDYKKDTGKPFPSLAEVLFNLGYEKKDTGKDKRNYEGPLSDDMWIRKARETLDQRTVVVDEKTMVNKPRYLRKEQMVRRPTIPCGYKAHKEEDSKL
ncbi:uncharacterized protein FTOL_02470 [Fusarium torulosum]|uniref:Uncharacterized protein n=1 Tax=Fusarium torulosum TaxID=33205 RepID=A0AAE8M1V5_9HYPO|nr:uncharacterized protein FTOL_02470 [Fusarium torulosum]